jgi:hypothetical protein
MVCCTTCGGYKGARSAALLCRCQSITLAEPLPLIPQDLRLVEEVQGNDPYNNQGTNHAHRRNRGHRRDHLRFGRRANDFEE